MGSAGGRRRAVVVGAGIGGLAAAAGLTRTGWDVLVLERSPELRTEGAGISLLANAQRSLDRLGVGERVRARAAVMLPGGDGVRRPSGRRLMPPANPAFVRRHGLSTAVLLRAELHAALRDAVPPDRIRTGTEVTGVEELAGGGVRVRYRDATKPAEVTADVAVAADGVHSRLRGQLWPTAPGPVYSGHSVWRGVAEVDRRGEPGGTTWGRGLEFGRMPLADGRVYWYAVANTPPGAHAPDEHDRVLRRFGTWHAPIPALLKATPPDRVLHHDVFELLPPLPGYVVGRTALLGDAAHAMTSDLGQGACQALEDAVVLCAELARHDDVPAALAAYDRSRRPRAQSVVEASHRMGRTKLRDAWWQVLLRDALMALVPPRAGEAALARIGDWHPPELTDEGGTAR
ncbi:FAD-dependent oxidoreductase [Streptomyces mashuensis]|uniref:FAD-dependent oxidoreductase n=1 Tax=Streptomyces mashuensis TaxID=33904 RepID=A0A919B6Z7_9ACTN|nr:FAD-dependent monooxygenase [Streptomyces mashuensis]GHF65542.1 FAD-dependent oxidoreductase [Streptomyces mashuensis]